MGASYMFKQICFFQQKPSAKGTSAKKACQLSNDKNFLVGEFQGSFAIDYQSPCQWSSEISFLQL